MGVGLVDQHRVSLQLGEERKKERRRKKEETTGQKYNGLPALFYRATIKNAELNELLGLEPVSVVIRKGRLSWFGRHVERRMLLTGSNTVL